jgi:hypothetical protein
MSALPEATRVGLAEGDAARWIVYGERDKSRSVIPQLREKFGLSLKQATAACREASLIRARAH